MRYYKVISDGYILMIGTGAAGEEITEKEYAEIKNVIVNAPTAPDGYAYALREALEWELVPAETPDIAEEAIETDYQAALEKMGVQLNGD